MLKTTVLRRVAQVGLLAALATGAGVVAASGAFAETNYGNSQNNCYGIWWNTDWNQECGSGGASATGYYKSDTDCSGLDTNESMQKYRLKGNATSYDGVDCTYGINDIVTWFHT